MNLNLDKSTWQRVKFGDAVRNVNNTVRDIEASDVDRIIAMEHMDPGELAVTRWGSAADGTTFTRRVSLGQTLFGKRRAYQRKVAYAEFEAICSGDIYTFEAIEGWMLGEFLPFLVQSESFFAHALGTSAGSLSPRTNWRDLQDFEFALPPLDEQKRIANLLWATERHRTELTHRARELHAAELAAISGSVRPDWPMERVDQLGDVQLGQQRHPDHADGPRVRPYLRVANVGDNELWLDDVASMDFSANGAAKFRLEPGDILLNEGQSIELVGRCAMFRGEIEDCYMQKTLLRFRAGERINREFALAWFRYCFHTGKFMALAKRTTSMAHLTAVRFRAMSMPVPSDAEQIALVNRVFAVEAAMHDSRGEIAQTLRLGRAIQRVVFGDE